MAYSFEQLLAADPSNPSNIAQNGSITIFAPGDETMTPLTITDPDGSPLPNPFTVNANGFGPAFAHATLDRVAWSGGGFTGFVTSYEGMKEEAVAARAAAESAAATAGAEATAVAEAAIAGATDEATAAKAAAETAASNASASATAAANSAALVGAPADSAIAAAVSNSASATKAALNATYVGASTGVALVNGAAAPGLPRTRSGRSHAFVAGVIRNYNDGAGWVLVNDGFHPHIGITGVDSLTDPGFIRVDYADLKVGGGNAGRTVTLLAQPDETLTKAGFTCGASVSPNFANIQLQQTRPLNDRVAWDTASGTYKLWKNDFDSRGLNRSPFTVNSATNNHLILGHPQAVMDDRYDVAVERIGGIGENYTPTISTSQAESILTQVTINFWTPNLTGTATVDWPSVADGAMASQTVTVTGCAVGDIAEATMSIAVPAGVQLTANVTAANTVTVTLVNRSGAAVDLASGTLTANTRKANGADYRVTTPDSKCRALVRRGMMRSYVAPADVNETTYPSGNIWIIGIMQDQAIA